LTDLPENLNLVIRTIHIYREGIVSPKSKHKIAAGYRKKIILSNGIFEYLADIQNEDIESILIDISETWIS